MWRLKPLLLVGIAMGLLAGCSSAPQRRVIGTGPVLLLFRNTGGETVDVEVHWTGQQGEPRYRNFDVEPDGRVDVRIAESQQYEVILDPETSTPVAQPKAETGPKAVVE